MAHPNTTRRQLLQLGTSVAAYAAGAAIVAGGVAVAGEAKGAAPAISPELRRLIAEADRTASVARDYSEQVLDPAYARFSQVRDAIPHIDVEGVCSHDGGPAHWSTEQEYRVNAARGSMMVKVKLDGPGSGHAKLHREAQKRLLAAAKRRDRQVHRASLWTGYHEAYDRSDELDMIAWEATVKAREYPVANHAELIAVLDLMEDQGTEAEVVASILSKAVRRLAGETQA